MEFQESNGILVLVEKHAEPTQSELHEAYSKLHDVCPECGSGNIESTCVGCVFRDLESAKDLNRASCLRCGWKGVVHDMKPSGNARLFKNEPDSRTATVADLIAKLKEFPEDMPVAYTWEGQVLPVVLAEIEVMQENDYVHGPVLLLDTETN